jgi:hypothetical protein
MHLMTETEVGDRIIVRRADGMFDLFKIDESGERVITRDKPFSGPIGQVEEAARASVPSNGQVWVCDEATPDVLKAY